MNTRVNNRTLPDQHELANRFRRKYWALRAKEQGAVGSFGGTEVLRRLSFSSVIVPLDGSRYAEHALPTALEVAAATKVPVVLESADLLFAGGYDQPAPSYEEVVSPRRRARMRAYLEALSQRVATDSVHISVRRRETPVTSPALHEAAKESDLVVIAQRPRRFWEPFTLRHPIERLLRFSSSPLILVRGYSWPFEKRITRPVKHVLVVLDGSKEAERVLPSALAIAEASEAKVTLLRIVPGMPYYGIPWEEKDREAEAYLANVIKVARERGIQMQSVVWSSNEPVGQVILSYAEKHNADLIALATSLRRTHADAFRRQPVRYLVRRSWIPLLTCGCDGL